MRAVSSSRALVVLLSSLIRKLPYVIYLLVEKISSTYILRRASYDYFQQQDFCARDIINSRS